MGILDSYNSIPSGYIPRNTQKSGKRKQVKLQPPYQKSANSFWWNYGDQFTFLYKPQLSIRVEDTALIIADDTPLINETVGFRGQKAYDIVNLISYTYGAGYNDKDGWIQDEKFTIPSYGTQEVTLRNIDWTRVGITFQIKNFRNEKIYEITPNSDNALVFNSEYAIEINIGEELSELLKYGSYKFIFILQGANDYAPIYLQNIFDISILQKRVSNSRDTVQNQEEEDDYDIHLILDGGEESGFGDCGCGF